MLDLAYPCAVRAASAQPTGASSASGCAALVANCHDELPLAHLRAPANAELLGQLVELVARAIGERVARAAAALPRRGALPDQIPPRPDGQTADRAFARGRVDRFLDVAARSAPLLLAGHVGVACECRADMPS